jgi:tetratricopeptide (TPR) repeat protein
VSIRLKPSAASASFTPLILALTALGVLGALSLSACGGKYRIKSEPSGAEVSINGIPRGRTPVDISLSQFPPGGALDLRVEKEDQGVFQAYLPSPSSGLLGVDLLVRIPKQEDDATKVNRNVAVVIRAQKLIEQKRYEAALAILDEAIKENPRYVHAQSLKGSALFLSQNYDAAQAQWRKVMDLDPANVDAKKMLEFINSRGLASQAPTPAAQAVAPPGGKP